MSVTYDDILRIYQGSNGEEMSALYKRLEALGDKGSIALNLFRATKCSERAKVYRGGGYRGTAYDRKQWSMDQLCGLLGMLRSKSAIPDDIAWGWAKDDAQPFHKWVLYVEIQTGQISFHTGMRGPGPDYETPWDGMKGVAPFRIAKWIVTLLGEQP